MARRSCPAGTSSAHPDPPQGPGALPAPPRVPAPATRFGGQVASAQARASRASVGRWGLLGRRPVWQTASPPGSLYASLCYLVLRPTRRGGPAVFIWQMFIIRGAGWCGWGGRFLGCPASWVGHSSVRFLMCPWCLRLVLVSLVVLQQRGSGTSWLTIDSVDMRVASSVFPGAGLPRCGVSVFR